MQDPATIKKIRQKRGDGEMMGELMGVLKDGFDKLITDESGENDCGRICTACVRRLNVELKLFTDAGIGRCGVRGCGTFTEYYIELKEEVGY